MRDAPDSDPTRDFIQPLDVGVAAEDPLWTAMTMNAIDADIPEARVSDHLALLGVVAHLTRGHPAVIVLGPDAVATGLAHWPDLRTDRPEVAVLFALDLAGTDAGDGADLGDSGGDGGDGGAGDLAQQVRSITGTEPLDAWDTRGIVAATDAALAAQRAIVRSSPVQPGRGAGPHAQPIAWPKADLRVVTVVGSKGGVGASTVAINLAAALARVTVERVTGRDPVDRVFLVDGHHGDGDLAFLLGLPRVDADGAVPVTPDNVDRIVQLHGPSTVRVVTPPAPRTELRGLTVEEVLRVLVSIEDRADIVVVDVPPALAHAAEMQSFSNVVLHVTSPQLAAVKNTLVSAEVMGRPKHAGVVINRTAGKLPELDDRDIDDALQLRIVARLPFDDTIAEGAVANPVTGLAPAGSGFGKRIDKLAEELLDGPLARPPDATTTAATTSATSTTPR